MTILDRARGTHRIHIDVGQLGDDLAKHVRDIEPPDLGKVDLSRVDLGKAREAAGNAVHDAADRARHAIDRAGDQARTLAERSHAAGAAADHPFEDLGQRLRAAATSSGVRAAIARLERELPDTDRDRYARAYARGRAQARSRYVVVGLAVGITAGLAAALLLDPKHGKARREAVGRRVSGLTRRLSQRASSRAKLASDRVHGMAIERGLVDPPDAVVAPAGVVVPRGTVEPIATPAWPAEEGPLEQPLHDPTFGAHEALPEELVSATASSTDPGEPTFRG